MEEEVLSPNMQKFQNYRNQFSRLTKALNAEFYLEAIFIAYAIIEDRTESILRHTGKWEAYEKSRRGRGATLDSKITYIQKMAEEKKSLCNRYLADGTLQRIREWKEERNRMIHALLKQNLSDGELAALAQTGSDLAKDLRTKTNNLNRAIQKAAEAEK